MAKCARCFKYKPAKGKELCTTCIVHEEKASGSVYPEVLTRGAVREVPQTARELWAEFTATHTQIFDEDQDKPIEELEQELLEEFTNNEKNQFLTARPKGTASSGERALFARRAIAVERLFMRLSVNAPQTKRHAYYHCKAIGLCGKDNQDGKKDSFFSRAIGKILGRATWEKRIPWTRLLDDSRTLESAVTFQNIQHRLKRAVSSFNIDLALGQSTRLIAITEKDAVIESIAQLCDEWFVPYMSFHGQASDLAIYKLAERITQWGKEGCKTVIVPYAGDFDKFGMTIDNAVFSEALDKNGEREGKIYKMLKDSFPECTTDVHCFRIGITEEDLHNPEYQRYVTDEHDLGIDILSTEEINRRFEEKFRAYSRQTENDQELWKNREQMFAEQKLELEALIQLYSRKEGASEEEEFQEYYEQHGLELAEAIFRKRQDLMMTLLRKMESPDHWYNRASSLVEEMLEETNGN